MVDVLVGPSVAVSDSIRSSNYQENPDSLKFVWDTDKWFAGRSKR